MQYKVTLLTNVSSEYFHWKTLLKNAKHDNVNKLQATIMSSIRYVFGKYNESCNE